MDAAAFASQLREALDYLSQGIPADPGDIDDITGARVTSYTDAGYLTDDAGFEITAPDGSQLQVTILQRALPRAGEAFWAEAERISRERVTPAARTPGRSSR